MAKQRLNFSAWNCRGAEPKWPAYAMIDADDWNHDPARNIALAIARKNNLQVITMRSDGYDINHRGDIVNNHYNATLGCHASGGGWLPVCEIGFSFDARLDQ